MSCSILCFACEALRLMCSIRALSESPAPPPTGGVALGTGRQAAHAQSCAPSGPGPRRPLALALRRWACCSLRARAAASSWFSLVSSDTLALSPWSSSASSCTRPMISSAAIAGGPPGAAPAAALPSSSSNVASLWRSSATVSSRLSSSSLSSSVDRSWLILTTFFIIFARCPNRRVLAVSCSLKLEGEHVMISDVLEFPPRDSCNTLVSLESLYGTCV
mmetsp:Transcript_59212/g.153849  ORF Transcript_59212/g.153849 Transcript_59212/m.153849 type:complete len:219 (-) Transcript_59212:226-882(-)